MNYRSIVNYSLLFKSRRINDIWINSWPRSGNTFLRHLLCIANYGSDQNLPTLMPDIHNRKFFLKSLSYNNKNYIFYKSHFSYSTFYSRIIYIYRNPVDAAVSWLYRNNPSLIYCPDMFIKAAIEMYYNSRYDSWSDNVNSYINAYSAGAPIVFIKYDDLIRRPHGCLECLEDFTNVEFEYKDNAVDVMQGKFVGEKLSYTTRDKQKYPFEEIFNIKKHVKNSIYNQSLLYINKLDELSITL